MDSTQSTQQPQKKKYVISKEKKKIYNERYIKKKHLDEVLCSCPYCYRKGTNAPIKLYNKNHINSKLHKLNKIEFEAKKDQVISPELQEMIDKFIAIFPNI